MKLDTGQYFGNTFRSVNINGLILTKTNYSCRSLLPSHYHQNPYFCFVLNGSYSEHNLKKEITCKAGDVVFHPGKTEHRNNFSDSSASCFNLELSDNWVAKIGESLQQSNSIAKSNDTIIQTKIFQVYKEFNEYDSLSPLMIEGLMIEILVYYSRANKGKNHIPPFVRKMLQYLDERYFTNPDLSELSGISGVSPEHLVREFKKTFNITIGEYIRQLKIKRSCNELRTTTKDLGEIAFEVGFADQSHFNRVFKKMTGFTPFEYRLKR
jgi:AraC family transcriptional regulator